MSSGEDRSARAREARACLDALDALLEEARRFFPLPGGVISVCDRDGLLAEAQFGYADLEREVEMSPHFRFEIGSISKLFTSLAVNSLVEEGRLRLDETIAEVLPWWEGDEANRAATVAQLLNHTSGVCVGADTLPDDTGEIWNSRGCATSPSPTPHFHYSNLGYTILGEMVRARSGRRLAELETEQWLAPLGMSDALAQVTQGDRASLATGYWSARPDRPWAPGDALAPSAFFEIDSASGNIAATSADMVALVQALLRASDDDANAPEPEGPLSRATFQRLIGDRAPTGEPIYLLAGMSPVEESRYGQGINVERIGGHLCVSHGGGMVGYSTFMLVDCTAQVGVVVLTNANGDTLASHVLARIVHEVLGRGTGRESLAGWSFDPTVCAGGHVVAGTYAGDDGSSLEVVEDGTELLIRCGDNEGRLFLFLGGRYVTDNPRLRTFHLDWFSTGDDRGFTYGATTYRAHHLVERPAASSASTHQLVGHYRSFSPWYPEFRIRERAGRLLLIAPGGVEAPGEETVLVEVAPGEYRVGEEDWLPDRLVIDRARDGEVISVNRDGCHYSRTFSD